MEGECEVDLDREYIDDGTPEVHACSQSGMYAHSYRQRLLVLGHHILRQYTNETVLQQRKKRL